MAALGFGKEAPFYLGYAHEALARAALFMKDKTAFESHLNEARALAAKVEDAEEKKRLQKDLASWRRRGEEAVI